MYTFLTVESRRTFQVWEDGGTSYKINCYVGTPIGGLGL